MGALRRVSQATALRATSASLILAQERSGLREIVERDDAARRFKKFQQGGKPRLSDRRAAVVRNEARQKRRVNAHQASEAFPRVTGSVEEGLKFLDKQHRRTPFVWLASYLSNTPGSHNNNLDDFT
jgi:hypothetical protein